MWIRMMERCVIDGGVRAVGDVIEVEDDFGRRLIGRMQAAATTPPPEPKPAPKPRRKRKAK